MQQEDVLSRLRRYSRELAREWRLVSNCASSEGLTVSEAHTLLELADAGQLTVQAVADMLLIDKSNASRTLKSLEERGLVKLTPCDQDRRSKQVSLTRKGQASVEKVNDEANELVAGAVRLLSPDEINAVEATLGAYAKAFRYSRRQQGFHVRPIEPRDNPHVADVIRTVSAEYNLRAEDGYAVGDPSVDRMYEEYEAEGRQYWVVTRDGRVVGGGGIAPLAGGDGTVCEFQKMYYLPECRGRGLGRRMVLQALEFARKAGYAACYLETTGCLKEATSLYERLGFEKLEAPLGETGHSICELFFLYRLKE